LGLLTPPTTSCGGGPKSQIPIVANGPEQGPFGTIRYPAVLKPQHEGRTIMTEKPAAYQIQVQGKLGPRWLHWFDDLAVTAAPADDGATVTTLSGVMVDQAPLRGILNKLWDLNLPLLSVTRAHPPPPGPPVQRVQQSNDPVSHQ